MANKKSNLGFFWLFWSDFDAQYDKMGVFRAKDFNLGKKGGGAPIGKCLKKYQSRPKELDSSTNNQKNTFYIIMLPIELAKSL